MCQERTFAVDGCLMAYGPSFPDMFRRAAYYVGRILHGVKPDDLPVEQTSKFELLINLKTAKASKGTSMSKATHEERRVGPEAVDRPSQGRTTSQPVPP
jgi:ABC-type uncharacterized transport system substrate-binding protein